MDASHTPSHEHIAFLSILWHENVNLTMNVLMHAFPDPEDLPNVYETVRYVHQCREDGYEPAVCDVLNGIPSGPAPAIYPCGSAAQRYQNMILGNEATVLRNHYPATATACDDDLPFAMWQ